MNVAYHCSDAYSRILAVSLASLFENNKAMKDINVFIIERGITPDNKKALLTIAEAYKRTIVFLQMPDINRFEDLRLKQVKKAWVFDSYCRLYLDDLLPENIEKVLYIDSDVIVADNLEELWNTDLTDYVAAGVKDCISKKYYELLGIQEGAHYCNSGVILINLEKWRNEKMGDSFRRYIHERNGYVFFVEQTVLNGVIQNQWKILDVRYNVNTLMLKLSYNELKTLRKPDDFYTENEVKNALEHPALIHMTNTFLVHNRAWIKGNNYPAKDLYNKYKALTPWRNEEDLPDNRKVFVKIREKLIDIIPNIILLPVVSFVYNYIRIAIIKSKLKENGVKQ